MNAIDFLLQEHTLVRKTFKDIENHSQESAKRKMMLQLGQDLLRHETMEEKVWYPNFQNDESLKEIIDHLISEEKAAAKAIQEIDDIVDFKEWKNKFSIIKKDVEHHAAEEENKLFPKVKKIMNETELERIGKEMQDFKEEFKEEFYDTV